MVELVFKQIWILLLHVFDNYTKYALSSIRYALATRKIKVRLLKLLTPCCYEPNHLLKFTDECLSVVPLF